MIISYFNPYHDQNFLSFFYQLFQRIFQFISGELSINNLATDEVQIITLIGISVSCSLIGVLLVLRRMTMLANSLSHTLLLGIVFAFLWIKTFSEGNSFPSVGIMMVGAILMGLITTFLTEWISKKGGVHEDASIGLVFTTLFALGVTCVTLFTRNLHLGIEAIMGNIDFLSIDDLKWVWSGALLNFSLVVLFFKEYQMTTFDPSFARAIGISPQIFNYLLMAQVAYTSMVAFRAVGVVLVLTFLTAPILLGRLYTRSLSGLWLFSVVFSLCGSLVGVALSRHFLSVHGLALSTSAIVALLFSFTYLFIAFYRFRWGAST